MYPKVFFLYQLERELRELQSPRDSGGDSGTESDKDARDDKVWNTIFKRTQEVAKCITLSMGQFWPKATCNSIEIYSRHRL